jgi:hypothetical protein
VQLIESDEDAVGAVRKREGVDQLVQLARVQWLGMLSDTETWQHKGHTKGIKASYRTKLAQ